MTKEELEKEATEYAQKLGAKDFIAKPKEIVAYFGYLAGAKPREKRIAELEAENLQLLKEWRIMDKAKQKAELKVAELMGDISTLEQDYKNLEAQIEKMKCCIVSCCEGCERLPKLYEAFDKEIKEK